ncbi:MAG: ferritin-like domain-containing protein [Planctomycetota bacterium]
MENQDLIEQLNAILRHEWTGVAQYAQASFMVQGVWRQVYAEKFEEDAQESFGHAELIGEKIAALGAIPTTTRNEISQSTDVHEILQFSLKFESKAVEMYLRAIELAANDRPLVVFLEDILRDEQEGVDEYTKLLRETKSAVAEQTTYREAV